MASYEADNSFKLIPDLPNPFVVTTKLISLQAEITANCAVSIFSFFYKLIFKKNHHQQLQQQPINKEKDESTTTTRGQKISCLFLGKIAYGLLAALYVLMVLMAVLALSAALGVGLVRLWMEEPICVRESLQFDYADAHPTAIFSSFGQRHGVPIGHTVYVSLALLMPESDYNRDLGIFQLTAEIISSGGDVIARSSRPSMLKFRSWPVRTVRTFLMGIPLLLGITTETQTITFPILKHKETAYPRTEHIIITLIPRSGTSLLPQFYDAEAVIRSRPPWTKELVYRWKWTFYVWTTFYVFTLMVTILVLYLKPLIFPVMTTKNRSSQRDGVVESEDSSSTSRGRESTEGSETLRRWQRSRSKRKAALFRGVTPQPEFYDSSSASSITVNRGEIDPSFQEGSCDSGI